LRSPLWTIKHQGIETARGRQADYLLLTDADIVHAPDNVAQLDPDQQFYENYFCGSQRNYSGYFNKAIDRLTDQQSAEKDQSKRKKIVWEIDSKLQEDAARPIIMHNAAVTCWQPNVKGVTLMANSSYNGWRMEDWWLDKAQTK
jgi:ABC-type transport system substrate-binding protein